MFNDENDNAGDLIWAIVTVILMCTIVWGSYALYNKENKAQDPRTIVAINKLEREIHALDNHLLIDGLASVASKQVQDEDLLIADINISREREDKLAEALKSVQYETDVLTEAFKKQ